MNKLLRTISITLILVGILILSACSSGTTPTANENVPTEVPLAIADSGVLVDGRLVPDETVELAFETSGKVVEVLVEEGDTVQAGDVLARLGNREQLESAIANAKLELLAAQQEQLSAEQALTKLNDDLPEAQTAALRAVTDARDALRDAERTLRSMRTPASEGDINEARATVFLAKDVLDKAREDYAPYEKKPESNLIRAALLNKLGQAQRNYDAAVRRLNNLEGTSSNEFNISQAEAELEIALARLDQSQEHYELLRAGPDPMDVSLIESRIATAKSRIEAANAAIVAAEATLSDLELVATIDGTIVSLDLIVGQTISAGVPVIQLADFSNWYVETDNLTEIEVVDVALGQPVIVSFDALPELEVSGVVEQISDVYEEKRGDITYTTRIKLEQGDPRLRWGMTAVVSFEQ